MKDSQDSFNRAPDRFDSVVEEAANDLIKEKGVGVTQNVEGFIEKLYDKFVQTKIDDFPRIVMEFRKVNYLKNKFHYDVGNPKGWSEDKDFKFHFDIPKELYLFMTNLVYKDFWSEDNRKVWQPFLKDLARGEDPMRTLIMVKQYYGSSREMIKAGEI